MWYVLCHCGDCSKITCDKLQAAFDDEEHGDICERLINLKIWAEGKEVYLKIRILETDNK